MPNWKGSDRRSRLPDNWSQLRRRVLKRDGHRCTARDAYGVRCDEAATDVDHVRPGDDHREANLTSLCEWHHRAKSSREGGAARVANWRRHDKRFRRAEDHPGLR
ncbi:hypothetical protein GCM10009550_20190 [Actinocorallia libanotica]|uniref:HNH endonuclease n=1 Tax=Actinocorallia libanotica TaxID=46162 RepID=A0ABN1QQT5_9ACTN